LIEEEKKILSTPSALFEVYLIFFSTLQNATRKIWRMNRTTTK